MSDLDDLVVESAVRGLLRILPYESADDAVVREFVRKLGWELPFVPDALRGLSGEALGRAIAALQAVRRNAASTSVQLVEAAAGLAAALESFVASVRQLPAQMLAQLPPEFTSASGIAEEFERRFFENALCMELERTTPLAFLLLRLLGVLQENRYDADASVGRARFVRRSVGWNVLHQWLSAPSAAFQEVLGWNTSSVVLDNIFALFAHLALTRGRSLRYAVAPAGLYASSETPVGSSRGIFFPLFEQEPFAVSMGLFPGPVLDGRQCLVVVVQGTSVNVGSVDLGDLLSLGVETDFPGAAVLALLVSPVRKPELKMPPFTDGGHSASGVLRARLSVRNDDPTGYRTVVSLPGFAVSAQEMGLEAYLAGSLTGASAQVEAYVKGGRCKLDAHRNRFLRHFVPAGGVTFGFDASAGASLERGFYLTGGLGLSTRLVISRDVGPLRLDGLAIDITTSGESAGVTLGVDGAIRLGPVVVGVGGFGVTVGASAGGRRGAGTVIAEPSQPDSYSLEVDAGIISGAGALHRSAADYYIGALVFGVGGVSCGALGIIDATGDAYSMLAAMDVDSLAVQLGLGFSLNGVGGLVGVNRRVDPDALRVALRGRGIDDIFFAADPLAQAARLLGDLARYFPAAEGRYTFGPAFKLGWGTPTIVDATLALLLEVPAPVRLVLLGNAKTALPTKDHPVVVLNVDVLGEVDFAAKTAAIDATLRDSKVVSFPITGDLAFRMGWGDPPNFVLSVGGFHSQFRAPAGFPELRRVRIPIGSGENPRLDAQGFLALTSNTAQVGAQVELYASAMGFNVKGAVGFETLIQFSPFGLAVDLWASMAFRRGTTVLMSVDVGGKLTGPTPWHIAGHATASICGFDVTVSFDATFGRSETVVLPSRSIWPDLQAALVAPESWGSELPAGAAPVVTTSPPTVDGPYLDPGAVLSVRQKVVPLERTIEQFAQVEPEGPNRFDIASVKLGGEWVDDALEGGEAVSFERLDEWFAPAQFEALSNAERLSRPGFERMVGGVSLGAEAVLATAELKKPITYETVLIPTPPSPPSPHHPDFGDLLAGVMTSASAGAPLHLGSSGAYAPPQGQAPFVKLHEEEYVIASTDDLSVQLDALGAPASRSVAELALRQFLSDNPASRGLLQVVPRFEAVEASP